MSTKRKKRGADQLLTVRDVATRLQLSDRQVVRLIQQRAIVAFKIGRLWRIDATSVEAFIQSRMY